MPVMARGRSEGGARGGAGSVGEGPSGERGSPVKQPGSGQTSPISAQKRERTW
jgi:hypothetical protein